MIISLGNTYESIGEAFKLIEITNSRDLIIHEKWNESLKDLNVLKIPHKGEILFGSGISLVLKYLTT